MPTFWDSNGMTPAIPPGFEVFNIQAPPYNAKGDGVTDDYAAIQAAFNDANDYDTLIIPSGDFCTSQTIVVNTARYINVVSYGTIGPHGSFDDYLIRFMRPVSSNPIGDLSNSLRIIGKLRLRCFGQCRGVQLWNQDCSDFWIDVERPYGTAIQLRTVRESVFWGPRIYNGKGRDVFTHGDAAPWDSGDTYAVDDLVFIEHADWDSGTSYAINDFVVGSDGLAYRSRTASNLNNDPTVAANQTYWVYVDYEYYKAISANTNKNPETFCTNAVSEGDRIWQMVFPDEAAIDINEDILNSTFSDATNAVTFYTPDVRNCDHKTLFRADVNNGTSTVRSIVLVQPHLHYIGQNYIDNISIPYSYGQVIRNYGIGAQIGRCTNISFIEPEMQAAEVSESYNCFRFGMKNTFKNCTLINANGGIVDGSAPRAVGVHVMPSMTSTGNRNMVNTRFSLDDANAVNTVDPNNKLIYGFQARVEALQGFEIVNPDNTTQHVKVYSGTNTPEGTLSAEPGSFYFRRGGVVPSRMVYAKTSGTGNTGWRVVQLQIRDTTAGRPAALSAADAPFMYFDTTLGIPIWWNGSAWVDATGATV